MTNTLWEVTTVAKEILDEDITKGTYTEEELYDGRLHEIADYCVPVYYHNILDVAKSDILIALEIPEC